MASEIVCDKLLLVEGIDEIIFLSALMNNLHNWNTTTDRNILYKLGNCKETTVLDKPDGDKIQIISVGGKTKFRSEFSVFIKSPGFKNLKSLAFIRDADDSFQSAFDSIVDVLRENNIPFPDTPAIYTKTQPRVGIYIMPDNKSAGTLETLCLNSKVNCPFLACTDSFIQCISNYFPNKVVTHIDKRRSLVYLSAMHEVDNRLGIGAQKGYWDLNNCCFNNLTSFVSSL